MVLPDFSDFLIEAGGGGMFYKEGVIVTQEKATLVKLERELTHALAPKEEADKSCENINIWTFSGVHQTGSRGVFSSSLNDYKPCDTKGFTIQINNTDDEINFPVAFVATPESEDEPIILTTKLELVMDEYASGNVKFTVRSWHCDGNPAGAVKFRWMCRVRIWKPPIEG